MKRVPLNVALFVLALVGVVLACGGFAGAQSPWQYGRIDSVKKSEMTSTNATADNTSQGNASQGEERSEYTISVHVQDRIIVGAYQTSATEAEPAAEWIADTAVQVEISGGYLYLRTPAGNLRLRVTGRQTAGPMKPITAEEKKRLSQVAAAPQTQGAQPKESMIGFSTAADDKAAAPEPAPPKPAPPAVAPAQETGTVTVRSVPYLSEVFVDGQSMGYTPAKLALVPGKHTFRVEKPDYKPWTKEVTVTVGSELTLEAILAR